MNFKSWGMLLKELGHPCYQEFHWVPIYIQQDATLHSLLYLETALHVSGDTSTHHQERVQLYLQHVVFVTQLLLPATIAAGSSNGLTNTRCCRFSCTCSLWWVEVTPETCGAVSRYNKLCKVASCWLYIGIYLCCMDPWTSKFHWEKCGRLWHNVGHIVLSFYMDVKVIIVIPLKVFVFTTRFRIVTVVHGNPYASII